jgi:phosphoheptose isomerase
LITCFANDYKYENWVVEAIKAYSSKKDLFILISSSGTSKNIVNAAQYCKKNNIDLITLSGFKKNNPLSQSGNINFHVESEDYNFIEMTHHIILVSIVDIFAKKIF